jgi:hypothetical protein
MGTNLAKRSIVKRSSRARGARLAIATTLVTGAVAGGSAACSALLDTSQFTTCTAGPDGGWIAGDCLACVQSSCCAELDACERDPACAACLTRGDPLLACSAGPEVASLDIRPLDGGALASCVIGACSAACASACVAVVPPASPATHTVTLNASHYDGAMLGAPGQAVDIASVQLCTIGVGCAPMDGTVVTGSTATLPFSAGSAGLGDGSYLDVEPVDPTYLGALVHLEWTVTADVTVDLRMLSLPVYDALSTSYTNHQASEVHTTGTLVAIARDCFGNPVPNLVLLPAVGITTPDPFENSDSFSLNAPGTVMAGPNTPLNTDTSSETGTAGIGGWVYLALPDGGSKVATFTPTGWPSPVHAEIEAEKLTYVWLVPNYGH